MSLEGNLSAFGLSEILQLIAVQQKSGMLSITSQDRARVLFFRDGSIISTRDRRRRNVDPLRDYLTYYGILTPQQLTRMMELSIQTKLDLTDVIVSEKLLSEDDMRKYFRDHIQEAVHEILTWDSCSYKFIPGADVIEGTKTWGEFNIEGILMESMRRIDEFPEMLQRFPNPSMRFGKVGDAAEDVELSTNEQTVLRLLGVERSISDLIARAKMSEFEVYEALKLLQDKELLHAYALEDPSEVSAKSKRSRRRTRRVRPNVLPVLLAVALFAAATGSGVKTLIPYIQTRLSRTELAEGERSIQRNRMEAQIRWLLEAHRATRGSYPQSLDRLVAAGLADPAFLQNVQRYEFTYRLTGDGTRYTLL